jgi:hypothetical protein
MDPQERELAEVRIVEVPGPDPRERKLPNASLDLHQDDGPDGTESSTTLLREAIDEARELVRLEAELARQEIKEELGRAKTAGGALGAAAVMAMAGITMLIATIAFAAGRPWLCALLLGVGLLAGAGAVGFLGYRAMPLSPLPATRERVEASLRGFKERTA